MSPVPQDSPNSDVPGSFIKRFVGGSSSFKVRLPSRAARIAFPTSKLLGEAQSFLHGIMKSDGVHMGASSSQDTKEQAMEDLESQSPFKIKSVTFNNYILDESEYSTPRKVQANYVKKAMVMLMLTVLTLMVLLFLRLLENRRHAVRIPDG